MYKLREQESTHPIGLNAVVRLCRVFEKATGTNVDHDFSNMPLTITDEIDSAFYHLVQEALVNAFKHGAASHVSVTFWYDIGLVTIRIRDDGIGAVSFSEGIGIRGMRERIEKLGGQLDARGVPGGFMVEATVQLGISQDE
jgi:two-component system NarL family sensor kinase